VANNGSSWTDAYTSLEQALSAAAPGQTIWVAAGTYKSSAASNKTFLLSDGMKMYGGFAGTESNLNQRNITANATTLDGDINGDDVPGDFTTNRSDNAQHVVTCVELASNPGIVVDGFIIRNGQTLNGSANPDLTRRGGGIMILGKTTMRNCRLAGNYGDTGAAVAVLDALANGVVVEDCIIENNKAEASGIFFLRNTNGGTIKRCTLRNNATNRGALYPSGTTNVLIDSCLIEGNNAGTNFAGGMFMLAGILDDEKYHFPQNKAANAAGIYIDNRDGGDLAVMENCVFEQDTATGFGGAGVYGWQATFNLKNSIFRVTIHPMLPLFTAMGASSTALSISKAVLSRIISIPTTELRSGITGPTTLCPTVHSVTTWHRVLVQPSIMAIQRYSWSVIPCSRLTAETTRPLLRTMVLAVTVFSKAVLSARMRLLRVAEQSVMASRAHAAFEDCQFIENKARFGGAIFTQNDTTRLTVRGCYFTGNNVETSGGCILVNSNIATTIEGTTFYQNFADRGGAVQASGDSVLVISNCYFLENFVTTQGAALNLDHVNCNITNSLFAKNINSGDGAGGAISSNASDGQVSRIKAVNCTFADNIAAIGSGVAQWEESEMANTELTLQNCLFQNPDGDNYAIEAGTPSIVSLGGNHSSDITLDTYLTATKDLNSTFQSFTNPDANEYRPTLTSPPLTQVWLPVLPQPISLVLSAWAFRMLAATKR
ncbi:MAG UNVERIFIED_CONTAM: right-handed parallel beta-helix repeat-containing protein, partial [Microcystis novacekii LVE1205-3]